MGPKLKKRQISDEGDQEKKRMLAREKQRQRRARLIGGDAEENVVIERDIELGKGRQKRGKTRSTGDQNLSLKVSDVVSLKGSSNTFQETPEELSVDVEIKEEICSEDELENTQEEEPESEPLPGPKGQQLFYDGVGYYYVQLYEDLSKRWLQCTHAECSTLAYMSMQERAPINLVEGSTQHGHPPNPARRDRILFLHTIKTRHANEHTPFSVIFQQEAYKNPVGASFFSFDKIQAHLQKKIKDGSENLSQESVLSAASTLSMMPLDRPSPAPGPAAKKRRTDDDLPTTRNVTNKLGLIKSLKDVTFTEHETNEEPTNLPSKPSERLPGPHLHSYIYHDGHGYYYKPLSISGNTRYLQCNTEGCFAQAEMALEEGSPISLQRNSSAHNHSPQDQSPKSSSPVQPVTVFPVKTTYSGSKKKVKKTIIEEGENQEPNKGMPAAKVVLNQIPKFPARKQSERIQGPEYYYDFKGHYYFTTRYEKNKRYLRCLFPTCIAEAVMKLEDNAEIKPVCGSRPHNHQPDSDMKYHTKIKKWEEQWTECMPSERLPSLRVQYCCYHDGRGYYYHQTSQSDNIRYLTCSEPGCPVRGHMCTQKDAPITLSGLRPGHSHSPDHSLRDTLLFIDAVRVRARSNTDPASAIALESVRNPVGAGRVDLPILQICLEKASKIANGRSNEGIVEDEVDFISCLKPQKVMSFKPSTESQVPVSNHFTSPRPMLNDDQSKNEEESYQEGSHKQRSYKQGPYKQTKPELVPALMSDSWLYHDGCGYYYTTMSLDFGDRFLQCVSPKCGVQGVVGQAERTVKLQRPHNHGPQPPQYRAELWFFHRIKAQALKNPDTPLAQIYKEAAEKDPEEAALISEAEIIQLMDKFLVSIIQGNSSKTLSQSWTSVFTSLSTSAERLPTTTFGRCQYHDGQGFYYIVDNSVKKHNITYLRCISRVGCHARATLVDGKVTMIVNTKHNHKPDLTHRDICLFSHALKKRARDEDTPISIIYQEEAKKYPKATAILREDRLKRKLISIRRYVTREIQTQAEEVEFEDGPNSNDKSQFPLVASEVFHGKARDMYHDGRGYFYYETFATNKLSYLICCEPHCLAQAKKERRPEAPVMEQVGAPRHCHAPDPIRRKCLLLVNNIRQRATQRNIKFETLYQQETAKEPIVAAQIPKEYLIDLVHIIRSKKKNADPKTAIQDKNEEDELWTFSEPCERLPSEHNWVYHNGKGYFYYSHEADKSCVRRKLKCCEDGCNATAWLEGLLVKRAPGSVLHNHVPEPRHSSMLVLLHKLALRAQLEHSSVANIFTEEAKLEPEGAALIPKNKLNEILNNLTISKFFKQLEEEELNQKENTSEDGCHNTEVPVVPCETLHSAISGKPVYHNRGYYFTELLKTSDRQYVKCLMPLCEARGYIVLTDTWNLHIPVTWAEHNHNSDLLYRNRLVFMHNVRRRVLKENTPINTIYSEECEREPVGADLVNDVAVKNLMHKLRKSKSVQDDAEEFCYENFPVDSSEEARESCRERARAVEKIFEPPLESQNNSVKTTKYKEYHKQQPTNPANVEVKVETEEDDDEYLEEEYLEEERLEEDLIIENSSMQSTNETSLQTDEVYLPSEKLPPHGNKALYYNGQGYYFHFNALGENVMHLRCTEPKCMVRAVKATDREDAPIIPTKECVTHNHKPDFTRRNQLLFVHRCKLRAATEITLTINDIWESEVAKDPELASQFSVSNVKAQMKRYRMEHAANSDILSMATKEQDNAEDVITFQNVSIADPVTENELNVDIHKGAVPEKIPSLLGESLWHAAGYFYSTYNMSPSLEKVKCVDKECVARAQVSLGGRGQPLSIKLNKNSAHCHPEHLHLRDQLLFIDRCKRRAATTLQSVEEIYYDEAAKAPQVASQLSSVRVKRAMGVAKKEKLKKGFKVDTKESEDSGDSGDHGMSELGEMANMVSTSTPVVGNTEETGAMDNSGLSHDDADYLYPEESLHEMEEDLWTVDPMTLSSEEKTERKRALARERQRRRRNRMMEDPTKWEQLEKEKEQTRQRALAYQRQKKAKLLEEQGKKAQDRKPKKTPKLGPKFLKERVKNAKDEEFQEQEELIDQTYSDYVTLEEDFDSGETDLKNDREGAEEKNVSVDLKKKDYQLVGHTVT